MKKILISLTIKGKINMEVIENYEYIDKLILKDKELYDLSSGRTFKINIEFIENDDIIDVIEFYLGDGLEKNEKNYNQIKKWL